MIFLYIVNYAHQTEQDEFMAINTFLRDMKDPNPKVRSLSPKNALSHKVQRSIRTSTMLYMTL